jgi:hypothetical protein
LPGLAAQETTWRPVTPAAPAQPPTAAPGATIGKPVPIMRGSSAGLDQTPRQFPAAYRYAGTALPPARPFDRDPSPSAQAIATVAPPGAVIAASGQSPPPAPAMGPAPGRQEPEEGLPSDLFAMDRPAPRWPEGLRPTGNWVDPYPDPNAPAPGRQPAPGVQMDTPRPAPGWPGESWAGPSPQRGPSLFYARGEYLLWTVKGDHAPPLVTTGDTSVAALAPGMISIPGSLNRGDTVVLFGGNITNNPFSGGRFTAGMVIDDCGDKAIEVGGFFLSPRSTNFAVTSAQVPFLARPFFAANPGTMPDLPREFVEVVSLAGARAGSVRIHSPSELWGLNADVNCKLCCGCDYRIDALLGARYLNLRESLTITEDNLVSFTAAPGGPFPPGSRVLVSDSFATRNEFYGCDMGLEGRWYYGRFDLDGFAKLAMGSTRQTVDINGSQTVIQPNGVTTNFRGGLLALPSNIGSESRDRFAVVPEVGVSLGVQVVDGVRLSVGYNFLYWSSVVRPGEQIDRRLDLAQIPNFTQLPSPPFGPTLPTNPTLPQRLFKESDFWAHGLTVGLEFTF